MAAPSFQRSRRGGAFLDGVVALGLILLAADALDSIGINFAEILHGALRFFGI